MERVTDADMMANTYSFEAARIRIEDGFGEVEDLTSLAGPPTAHHIMNVVLHVGQRKVKVSAMRDTGSPDTIITKGLHQIISAAPLQPCDKDFSGLGAAMPSKFLGLFKPLVI